MNAAPVIFNAVHCRYGRQTVLDAVDLRLAAGEHVALTGTNGSGKTTLLRAALGLHPFSGGTVSMDGPPPPSRVDWARRPGWGWVDSAPGPLHTLSGGQLQRAFLARALGCVEAGARVLFADEPSAR